MRLLFPMFSLFSCMLFVSRPTLSVGLYQKKWCDIFFSLSRSLSFAFYVKSGVRVKDPTT